MLNMTLLRCEAWKEDGMWVSHCLELGIASCGSNFQEARENLHEAITVYLEELRRLHCEEKKVAITPAPQYLIRALLFDIRYKITQRRKDLSTCWIERGVELAYA